jgi:tRNA A37 threonylcarbamoyladenosine dehydratase
MDFERRFGGVGRLYGQLGLSRLRNAHVCVVGIGGVGSWAVEALARTAVGHITMIDLDMVAESNANRQIQALEDVWGMAKVDAMSERIQRINPECKVDCVEEFVTPENVSNLLDREFSVVIDAIDQVRAKVAMIAYCHRRRLPIVVAGAAGGQMDPGKVCVTDLSKTIQDPLLAKVRSTLRREHGFPCDQSKFSIPAVFSTEALSYPTTASCSTDTAGPSGLNCAGFGSSVCVTSVFGMTAASHAIGTIIKGNTPRIG